MSTQTEVKLDRSQVKKAVQALQAFLKTKASAGESLFPDEPQTISLLFTWWRIPKASQKIFIPLPHGKQSDIDDICLFTKDEPKMTSDQTQRFYQKLLQKNGFKNTEIIPYHALKTEYKPYEAKRRLVKNFQVFLSDDRVYRLLPSHLGKHFYQSKKPLIGVNLQSKHLARDIQRHLQGTSLTVTNKGSCCMAHVAHSNMSTDEVTQNVEEAVKTVAAKIKMKGRVIKMIHLKSHSSVALPIYTSDLSHLLERDAPLEQKTAGKKDTKEDKKPTDKKKKVEPKKREAEEEEEEIPQLVPMETPSKRSKLEKPFRKQQLQKATKPAAVRKEAKGQSGVTQKAKGQSGVTQKAKGQSGVTQKAKVRKEAKGQRGVTQKAGKTARGRRKGAPVR